MDYIPRPVPDELVGALIVISMVSMLGLVYIQGGAESSRLATKGRYGMIAFGAFLVIMIHVVMLASFGYSDLTWALSEGRDRASWYGYVLTFGYFAGWSIVLLVPLAILKVRKQANQSPRVTFSNRYPMH